MLLQEDEYIQAAVCITHDALSNGHEEWVGFNMWKCLMNYFINHNIYTNNLNKKKQEQYKRILGYKKFTILYTIKVNNEYNKCAKQKKKTGFIFNISKISATKSQRFKGVMVYQCNVFQTRRYNISV